MIPVNEPLLDGNEKKYLAECIDTGWISSDGPFVKKFEEDFAKRVDRKYGIAVANGSVALEVAVAVLGIGKGDEVILPTFTIISCAAAIVRAGATPVVVDSDPKTWNMSVENIESRITSRTKAIMVVHIYGIPVDMDPILVLAEKYNLMIIEDAAELIGQKYKGKPCGSFGDISIFSFYPNKHITTGEGGMVLTNDEKLAAKSRELRNLSFIPPRRFIHKDLGWNFRMTNLQAAIGVAQLERLDDFLIKKRRIGAIYNELLSEIDCIQLPIKGCDYASNIYWVYGIVMSDEIPYDAFEAMKKLASAGVGTRPFFYPMHRQPVFNDIGLFLGEQYPVAERLGERGFYVPSGLAITEEQIHSVAEALKELFK
ncbi:DegT/DnrJ/EryC1/StrS family aminotransferase [bacterium]|nr:DegT/DnrJ/EryC1/StrS family aminotransferase [bacterium]NUN46094.1 DegT/DnrJ/EryC1/StrS family aminotransferase [bacterium]